MGVIDGVAAETDIDIAAGVADTDSVDAEFWRRPPLSPCARVVEWSSVTTASTAN